MIKKLWENPGMSPLEYHGSHPQLQPQPMMNYQPYQPYQQPPPQQGGTYIIQGAPGQNPQVYQGGQQFGQQGYGQHPYGGGYQ